MVATVKEAGQEVVELRPQVEESAVEHVVRLPLQEVSTKEDKDTANTAEPVVVEAGMEVEAATCRETKGMLAEEDLDI